MAPIGSAPMRGARLFGCEANGQASLEAWKPQSQKRQEAAQYELSRKTGTIPVMRRTRVQDVCPDRPESC